MLNVYRDQEKYNEALKELPYGKKLEEDINVNTKFIFFINIYINKNKNNK